MRPYLENKSKEIYASLWGYSYDFPSHFHSNMEIAYCFYGSQGLRIGNKEYVLREAHAVVIFPNTPHEYFKTYDGDTQSVSVICNTRVLLGGFPDITAKYPIDPFVSAAYISSNAICGFSNVVSAKDNAEKIGWAYIILSDILKPLEFLPLKGDGELSARVVSYIDENFKEPLTIDYISKIFGYTPSYVAHIFCDQLKIPFRTYLGAVRAEYAALQIRTTQKSLTEIAYESGCNSLNNFCRCFKKHFNKTPSQYKKECKK